jgi:hypothetical protein
MDIDTELETKAGVPHDAVVTHGEMMPSRPSRTRTTSVFAKHDADVALEEKLARINATIDALGRKLDEITLKSVRLALGGARGALRSTSAPGAQGGV